MDEIGQTQNQQPSNIYNIPDYPKDYTLYEADTGTNIKGAKEKQPMPTNLATANKIIYDASSCPVNWRMFGPIQRQVLDWSANLFWNKWWRKFRWRKWWNWQIYHLIIIFFKQPGMPQDCSAVFVNSNPKKLELSWDIPFNRLSGTTFTNDNPRFFCKNNEDDKNWLPAFNDFVIDISSKIPESTTKIYVDALFILWSQIMEQKSICNNKSK